MFNFTYAPGTTLQQMLGFEIAGRVWDAYLNDSVTINLYVGTVSSSTLPDKVIGGALPGMRADESYSTLYNRLSADRKSTDDATAVRNLDWFDSDVWFDKWVNGVNEGARQDSTKISLTRANAKALGYTFTDANELDGYIMFSDLAGASVRWNYDYTRSFAAGSNTLDFLSTVVHEIGHVLGFVSAIDRPGWLYNSFDWWTSVTNSIEFNSNLDARADMSTPLDLFRYSNKSRTASLFNSMRDMSYGSWNGDKYFSIDKGATSLGVFSTGGDKSLGGDGQQASHWKAGGIMAPTLAAGARPWLTNLDLRALDVIGWDVNPNPTINLSNLFLQSLGALATRAGQTTLWVTQSLGASVSNLVSDRTTSVNTMLTKSRIYNWGNEPGDGSWQRIYSLMGLQGVFSSLDELDSAVSVNPNEMSGVVLTQIDLKALLGSQGQQPSALPQTISLISSEQPASIAPIDVKFSVVSSTPSLTLPSQGLDAAKIWQMGEKKSLNSSIESESAPKTTKKPSLVGAAIDE